MLGIEFCENPSKHWNDIHKYRIFLKNGFYKMKNKFDTLMNAHWIKFDIEFHKNVSLDLVRFWFLVELFSTQINVLKC